MILITQIIALIIEQITIATITTTAAIIANTGPTINKKKAIMCIVINSEYNVGLNINNMMLNRK